MKSINNNLRRMLGSAVVSAVLLLAASGAAAADLAPYRGIYRGIMRSDSSPIAYGEVELDIRAGSVVIRIATGRRVEVLNRNWAEFSRLGAEEAAKLFRAGSPYPARVTAFRSRLRRWPMTMVFLRKPDASSREFALTLRHDNFDTMLYGPDQVRDGAFDTMLSVVEKQYGKGKLPRLSYGGLAAPSATGAAKNDGSKALAALKRKDCAEALALSRPAAEAGDPVAQSVLAALYGTGCGVPANAGEALTWYDKAARQGNVDAQLSLIQSYDAAARQEKDPARAKSYRDRVMDYYQMAADQDVVKAQHNLANLKLASGDKEAAAVWFQAAAEQGFAASQHNLAILLKKGEGVPQDLVGAYMWYLLSAGSVPGSAKALEELNGSMSSGQIAKAKRMAAAFVPRKGLRQ